jgi:hypothetical protein
MIAAACGALDLGSAQDDGRLGLTDAVLGPPLDPEAAAAASYHVDCRLDRAVGLAEVVSSTPRTSGGMRHLSAGLRHAISGDPQAAAVAAPPGISLRVRMQALGASAAGFTASPALLATVTAPTRQLDVTGFVVHPAAAEAGQSLSAAMPTEQDSASVQRLGEPAQWDACLPRPRRGDHKHVSSMQVVCVRLPHALAGTSVLKVPFQRAVDRQMMQMERMLEKLCFLTLKPPVGMFPTRAAAYLLNRLGKLIVLWGGAMLHGLQHRQEIISRVVRGTRS